VAFTVSARLAIHPLTPSTDSNKAINAGLADPKIKERFSQLGVVPMAMTPAEFGKFIGDETEKWGKVIRAANIKAE
jgi:tripartite-type tricarboxylate transporter receptor subunit TctC